MVISTSTMFMGIVTLPVLIHHRRSCSFVVDVPTRTYFFPPLSAGPLTKLPSTTTIELRSLARGSKREPGRDVKFGSIDASISPSDEMRMSPLLSLCFLSERPKTGDHE
jgi:hypothetical protein